MTKQFLRVCVFATGMMLIMVSATWADEICTDKMGIEKNSWQLRPVQKAMDIYLRDHRIRVNWLNEPRPPNAVGRDYYECLWIDEFCASMKAELVQRYCAGAAYPGAKK